MYGYQQMAPWMGGPMRRMRGFPRRYWSPGPWHAQRMAEIRAAEERAAAEQEYLRAGWGTPGWAMNVAPGYSVPGTRADNPAYYGAMESMFDDDALDAELDAILAEEDVLASQEDFGALTAPGCPNCDAQYGGHGYGAQPEVIVTRSPEPSHFVDSVKMGAGLGLGFLAVGVAWGLVSGRVR